jgi:hypothetical protein
LSSFFEDVKVQISFQLVRAEKIHHLENNLIAPFIGLDLPRIKIKNKSQHKYLKQKILWQIEGIAEEVE